MVKAQQALENALRFTLNEKNLPSEFPDFQALTRELVRQLAPYAVVIDRKTYVELTRTKGVQGSTELNAVVARYTAFNDQVEASLSRKSTPPPPPNFILPNKQK